jgi:hypothetical protein
VRADEVGMTPFSTRSGPAGGETVPRFPSSSTSPQIGEHNCDREAESSLSGSACRVWRSCARHLGQGEPIREDELSLGDSQPRGYPWSALATGQPGRATVKVFLIIIPRMMKLSCRIGWVVRLRAVFRGDVGRARARPTSFGSLRPSASRTTRTGTQQSARVEQRGPSTQSLASLVLLVCVRSEG